MNTKDLIDRLNFAATDVPVKAARELCKEAADAIERLTQPVGGEPVGRVLSESEMGIGFDRKFGKVIWYNAQPEGDLYSTETVARLLHDLNETAHEADFQRSKVARLTAERDETSKEAIDARFKLLNSDLDRTTLQEQVKMLREAILLAKMRISGGERGNKIRSNLEEALAATEPK